MALKKLAVLMLAGALTFGSAVTAFAAEQTVTVKAGDYIISKGNPEGTTDNLKKYIIIHNLTTGGGFGIADGSKLKCYTSGDYKIVGNFEIQKSDGLTEKLDVEVKKETADKINEISKADKCSAAEAIDKAVGAYQAEDAE